jgi:hypothetical protein
LVLDKIDFYNCAFHKATQPVGLTGANLVLLRLIVELARENDNTSDVVDF